MDPDIRRRSVLTAAALGGTAGALALPWDELPKLDDRHTDYARALASLGINSAVINNVNTGADYLDTPFLDKLAALAGVLGRHATTCATPHPARCG
ncbi:hypothetical protein [Streptomyces sp. NPDC050560]|uniref:hypothetical protein n=1 Tax=Streptomyces sp. NPDC050560 TaxID=3365630 RepID=UPI0037A4703A